MALFALAPFLAGTANAQPAGKVWRIGFLATYARPENLAWREAFIAGMRELGWVEGKDYAITYAFGEGDLKRLGELAAGLLGSKPALDLIFAPSTEGARAARGVTRSVPIVIATSADPIAAGLATSLARPGGNVTGPMALGSELIPKRMQLLREIRPDLQRVGVLHNPDGAIDNILLAQFMSACKDLGLSPLPVVLRGEADIAEAFAKLQSGKAQALTASATVANVSARASLVRAANKLRLLGIYGSGEFVDDGGLMSYSPNYADQYRRAAAYVDKILKGAKPGDLPIEQATTFELVVSLRTAKALGVRIPQSVLLRAARVIE